MASAVASGLAAFAFALLTLAIWFDDSGSEFLWRAWGVVAITALWASHWSLVLRARRPRTPRPCGRSRAGRVERIATAEDAHREAAALRRLAERAHD